MSKEIFLIFEKTIRDINFPVAVLLFRHLQNGIVRASSVTIKGF